MSTSIVSKKLIRFSGTPNHPDSDTTETNLLTISTALTNFFTPSFVPKVFLDFGFFTTNVTVRMFQTFNIGGDYRQIYQREFTVASDYTGIVIPIDDIVQFSYFITLQSGSEPSPVPVAYLFSAYSI